MNGIANQYTNMLQWEQAKKLVILLISVTIIWQPQVHIHMHIIIFWKWNENKFVM